MAGADELRIFAQLQAADDHESDFLGLRRLDLALDRCIFNGPIFGSELGLRPGHPLGVDDHVGLRGVPRWRDDEISNAEHGCEAGHEADQAPLSADKVPNQQQRKRSGAAIALDHWPIRRELPGYVHPKFLEIELWRSDSEVRECSEACSRANFGIKERQQAFASSAVNLKFLLSGSRN